MHLTEAVRDYIEKVAGGSIAQAIEVIGRRGREAALHDHAMSGACVVMTGGAVDVVPLAAARQVLARDGKREIIYWDAVRLPGVKLLVNAQVAARHSAGNRGPLRPPVLEEIPGIKRPVLWLNVHIHAAADY